MGDKNTKPDLILWGHKYNEWDNYSDNSKILSKNNIIFFLQRVDLTFKSNLVFYFLMNDLAERIEYKLFGYKTKSQLNDNTHIDGANTKEFLQKLDSNFQLSADIYEQRTIKAINYAQNFDIDFYIVSLFGKYENSNSEHNKSETFFYNPKFYDYWFETAEKISKNYNINFLKTENFAKEIIKIDYLKESKNKKQYTKKGSQFFCDNFHHTLEGNILTAKIINNYLSKYYGNYLKKIFINLN